MQKIFDEMKIEIGNTEFLISFLRLKKKIEAKPIEATDFHAHPFFEVQIAATGSFKIVAEEESYQVEENEILFLPPNFYHYAHYNAEKILRYGIGFVFSKTKQGEDTYSYFEKAFSLQKGTILKNVGKLCKDIKKIFQILLYHKPMAFYQAKALFTLWMIDFFKKLELDIPSRSTNSFVFSETENNRQSLKTEEEFLFYLDTKLSGAYAAVSLQSLSDELYLSKKQLTTIIKKRYGMTFKQKLSLTRIENIKSQLTKTDKTVKEIATAFGYTNLTSFYKTFEKIVGCTPAEYRKNKDNPQ